MCKKREKRLPDATLEKYVLTVVLDTINAFFSSPFSENSTSLQVVRRCCLAGPWLGRESSSPGPPKQGLGARPDQGDLLGWYLPACSLLQTHQTIVVQLLQSAMRLLECPWLQQQHRSAVEACIRTLAMVGKEPAATAAAAPAARGSRWPRCGSWRGAPARGCSRERGPSAPGCDFFFLSDVSRRDQGGAGVAEAWARSGGPWRVPARGGPGNKGSVCGGFAGLCLPPARGRLAQAAGR